MDKRIIDRVKHMQAAPKVDKETALARLRTAVNEYCEENKELFIRQKSGAEFNNVQEQITNLQLALCEVYELMEEM